MNPSASKQIETENFPLPPKKPNGIETIKIKPNTIKIFFGVNIPLIFGSRHFIRRLLERLIILEIIKVSTFHTAHPVR